jgi:hypothetical protein
VGAGGIGSRAQYHDRVAALVERTMSRFDYLYGAATMFLAIVLAMWLTGHGDILGPLLSMGLGFALGPLVTPSIKRWWSGR